MYNLLSQIETTYSDTGISTIEIIITIENVTVNSQIDSRNSRIVQWAVCRRRKIVEKTKLKRAQSR